MHVAVDHAGQDVQAAAIDDLGRRRADIADCCDPAARNGEISLALAVLVDDRAALENEVETACHHALLTGGIYWPLSIPIHALERPQSAAYVCPSNKESHES